MSPSPTSDLNISPPLPRLASSSSRRRSGGARRRPLFSLSDRQQHHRRHPPLPAVHNRQQPLHQHTTTATSSSALPSGTAATDFVELVDDYGRITPEMAEIVGRMTLGDVSNLLLNIQRWIQQAPAAARTVLTECPELCEALLEAQMCTGMMQQQFTAFRMLSTDELHLADRMSQERTALQNAMSSLLLLRNSKSIERKRALQSTNDVSSQSTKRSRDPPSPATLKLADEVASNDDMLQKMLNTPMNEIVNFPEEQRRKVLAVRQVLRARGYAVAEHGG
eukprot:GHVS01064340.1.p1 GENE.GHVS01064340.1~~GHVS01064340.1.p1  ORF type:complete len:279 (+),score=57.79 GHVS01064340.1:502-1338(+)